MRHHVSEDLLVLVKVLPLNLLLLEFKHFAPTSGSTADAPFPELRLLAFSFTLTIAVVEFTACLLRHLDVLDFNGLKTL